MYRQQRSVGQVPGRKLNSIYCELGGKCVTTAAISAGREACNRNAYWPGFSKPTDDDCASVLNDVEVDEGNMKFFSPCEVAQGNPCEEAEEGNMHIVAGVLLAVIVAGGVGYAVSRKRKKGRR